MSNEPEVPRRLSHRFDVNAVQRQAARMAASLQHWPSLVDELRADPIETLAGFEEITFTLVASTGGRGQDCSVLGSYDAGTSTLTVTRTSNTPQMWFSALHELGHHVLAGDLDWAEAVDGVHDRRDRHRLEEQVCEAFAAEILLGVDRVVAAIGDVVPTAADLRALHLATGASRSACAVRVAQLLRADGLVIITNAADNAVFFTAPSGDVFRPRRGTIQPAQSVPARAARAGSCRDRDARVTYSNGRTQGGFSADAVRDGDYVYSVFTTGRPGWATGAHVPSRPQWDPSEIDCPCGSTYESGRGDPCTLCGKFATCPDCGQCPCRTPQVAERTCMSCFLLRHPSQFEPGSDTCNDCRQ